MSNELIEENSKFLYEKYGQPRPGLVNPGNASYMCSSFQALFACEWFRERILKVRLIDYFDPKFFNEFSLLFVGLMIENSKSHLISHIQKMVIAGNAEFGAQSEHNPIDFIVELFVLLDKGLGDVKVSNVFNALLDVNMSCKNSNCKYKKSAIQEFNVVDLTVPPPKSGNRFPVQTLIHNLNAFGTYVTAMYCKDCNERVVAKKSFQTTNQHLIFNLKRSNTDRKVIIEDVIIVSEKQFNLVSFICYNMSNGVIQSYSCCARFGQNWYYFDDSEVIHISDNVLNMDLFEENVQILFYQNSDIACNFDQIDEELLALREAMAHFLDPKSVAQPQPSPGLPHEFRPTERDLDLIHATLGRGAGLANLINTCYMNATLQALFHCDDFRLHILFGQHTGEFHKLLRLLFQQLAHTREPHIRAEQFTLTFQQKHLDFTAKRQHDAREFLGEVLNRLNEEANDNRVITVPDVDLQDSVEAWRQYMAGNNNSHMVQTFAFQNETRSVCTKCKGNWIRFTHSWITLLVFPPNVGTNPVDVQTCINHAMLAESVQMTCLRCNRNCKVNRFTSIRRPPRVLVIQLQVYVVNNITWQPSKLNPNLTVNEFITVANELFNCFACVIHLGKASDKGHYTSFCKRGNDWHYFNDWTVNRVSTGKFPTDNNMKCTYLVFYERASAKSQLKSEEVSAIDFSGISVPEHRPRSGSGSTSGISRRGHRGKGRAPQPPGHQR